MWPQSYSFGACSLDVAGYVRIGGGTVIPALRTAIHRSASRSPLQLRLQLHKMSRAHIHIAQAVRRVGPEANFVGKNFSLYHRCLVGASPNTGEILQQGTQRGQRISTSRTSKTGGGRGAGFGQQGTCSCSVGALQVAASSAHTSPPGPPSTHGLSALTGENPLASPTELVASR